MENKTTSKSKVFTIVSIDGNIGSGKTTLLDKLRNHYKDNKSVLFLKEPVDEWSQIKDKNGDTILKKFYSNQEKYSFPFQMMAYISRLKILRDTLRQIEENEQNEKIVIFTERSLHTDKNVFAKMLYEDGKIEDVCYQIYLNWFDEFSKDFPIEYTIYVNTDPQNCYNRIHKRSREGEEIIPLEYLKSCHNYHEKFLNEFNTIKLELDGNVDIFDNENIVDKWLQQINDLCF